VTGRPRLTLFAVPKESADRHIETIQRNAIRSWTLLEPRADVLLLGGETAERLAAELGVAFSREVEYSENGAPLVSSVFESAGRLTTTELLGYANADILLLDDFATAVERLARSRRRFVMAGRRWDLDVLEELDFSAGWESRLRATARRDGTLHPPAGSDYFVFPRGVWQDLPPFALGRAGWDNWLISHARALGVPLVDASRVATVIHQNHDYSHLAGGVETAWHGPDAARNADLAGGGGQYVLWDASHVLTRRFVVPALGRRYLSSRLHRYLWAHPAMLRVWARARHHLRRLPKLAPSRGR
jgi:hypothetical protein